MLNIIQTRFGNFLQGWLLRQQDYLDQLLLAVIRHQQQPQHEAAEEEQIRGLVRRVLLHYGQYYEGKAIEIQQDVFLLFSPPWFTNCERAFLWIAGFRPSLLFCLVTNSIDDLNVQQVTRMEILEGEIRWSETVLGNDFDRVQESMADTQLAQLAIGELTLINGEIDIIDEALRREREAMELLVRSGDSLRTTTAREIVEILRPVQALKFLVAVAQLQLKLHRCGMDGDTR